MPIESVREIRRLAKAQSRQANVQVSVRTPRLPQNIFLSREMPLTPFAGGAAKLTGGAATPRPPLELLMDERQLPPASAINDFLPESLRKMEKKMKLKRNGMMYNDYGAPQFALNAPALPPVTTVQ